MEKRYSICEEIWELKRSRGIDLKDPERETEIKARFKDAKLPKGLWMIFLSCFLGWLTDD
ncbi:MAG: chorismate mutase [Nanoarchaeota archaeon]|nr:chorismate mutase [Nanoarchaeota archaeon]MBU0977590.1 chorismate mutase [Nanoarchaeota archaeon]